MNVRETMANHSRSVTVGAVALTTLCLCLAVYEFAGPRPKYATPTKAYFTDDDGKTLFADDISKIPPFDHHGAEAVRAMVYSSDGGKHQWVQYLVKCPDAEKPQLEQMHGGVVDAVLVDIGLVKIPGEKDWLAPNDAARTQVVNPKRPDDMPDGPIMLVQP